MRRQLVPDCSADEVGAVGVEALLHEQIDPPEIDETQVDSYLLGVDDVRSHSGHGVSFGCWGSTALARPAAILVPSKWMVNTGHDWNSYRAVPTTGASRRCCESETSW